MTIYEKLQSLVKKATSRLSTVKFFSAKLSDNTAVQCTGDLAKGVVLNSVDDGGNASPLADGSYKFDTGGSVVIKDGVVESFVAPAESAKSDVPKEQAQAADDKAQADKDKADSKKPAPKPDATDDSAAPVKADAADGDPDADDDSVSSDDVTAAIAQALAPIISQLQTIQNALTGAVTASTEAAKETKANTEMVKQTQLALSEISEVVMILSDEPSVKKVDASAVNPLKDSESFMLRTAHLKK